MDNIKNEKLILEKIAQDSIYAKGITITTTEYCGEVFRRYIKKGSVLELGPAEGVMTDILYPLFPEDYTIVDGSEKFANDLKKKYNNIKAYCSLFEDFRPNRKYDNIILGHVIEHVQDPVYILQLCKSWLKDGGIILTAVPNKNSIHRQAAVQMGLLKKLDDYSAKDIRHAHRRVLDLQSLSLLFEEARLEIIQRGGYWLKPLSDKQIEETWTPEMISAFLILGELYPDIAGEIYIIAKLVQIELLRTVYS